MYFITDFKNNKYEILNDKTGVREYYDKQQVLELSKLVKINGVSENDIKIIPVGKILLKYSKKLASLLAIGTSFNDVRDKWYNYCDRLGYKDILMYEKDNSITREVNLITMKSKRVSNDTGIYDLVIPSFVQDMDSAFFDWTTYVKSLNFTYADTSNVQNMFDLFDHCSAVSLDISSFDTSNVIDMTAMFNCCKSLETLDLSNFDTSNVELMKMMFSRCSSLKELDLSSFNTKNVENMLSMFEHCTELEHLDLSSFDTSNVTNMGYMFVDCYSLKSVDLSSFNTKNVTSMSSMFKHCRALKHLDLSSFDTSNVFSMECMFFGCISLEELDLSYFDTSKVHSALGMFTCCYKLKTVYLSEKSRSLKEVVPSNINIIFKD